MKKALILTVFIVLIPVLIVGVNNNEEVIRKFKFGFYNNEMIRVKRNKTNEVITIPLEEYVIGVVAGEMPASFNLEALKAQAVASRTYVLKRKNNNDNYDVVDSVENQVYIDYDQMKEKWKDNYEENLKKIKNAVIETNKEVLLYDNKIIDAMFFSTSNGYTENSGDVFSSNLPYLISVESIWDKNESPVFYSTKELTKTEFLFNLGLNIENEIVIKNIEKTTTGRVKNITINDTVFKSSKIREAFNLKSTSFNIDIKEEKVIISVNGYGHGVGMSQYGANGMAKEGFNYKEILTYYYKNCEIKKTK